jgi:hypothetical protein
LEYDNTMETNVLEFSTALMGDVLITNYFFYIFINEMVAISKHNIMFGQNKATCFC